ncbi:MAG: peptidase domain-containing ABC transporter, partial [Bacteroidales bacterium]|nr:peptidase domain-containing ABC transporter [Bacteroidales bacterium]
MKLIHQLDGMDCGAASLAMIVAHYGGTPNMDQIRELCQLNKLGVSLLAISRSAEQLGFKTVGGRITAENLVTQHVLPCILHWDQEHFVVLHRVKRRRNGEHTFYVADPGKGKLAYSADEFYQHWVCGQSYGRDVGIALLLEPQSAFFETKGQNHRPKTRQKAAFLWGYMRRYKRFWAQLLLGLLAGTGVQLLFPFFTQAIVDVGVGSRDIGFVWLVLLAQAMLLVSRTAIEFIRSKILLHISTRINISLISNFFIKLMRLPMRFFDTKLMGDLLQRIEDHRRVENFLTANSLTLIFSLFSFLIF